ncbi:MAG: hypothetical protein VX938_13175, partial [Myxococcota bacterium]|nr:hypothetical protein [Myxococcota bacterium]
MGDRCDPIPPSVDLPVAGEPDAVSSEDTGPVVDIGEQQPVDVAPTPQKDTTVEQAPEIGAPCMKDDDCGQGVCLDWPGGYCTLLDCEEGGCPVGSRCALLKGGNTGCLTTCNDGDCAGDDQGCKLLTGIDGSLSPFCYGADDDGGGIGSPCDDHVECLGNTTCLSSFPGGDCGLLGCGPEDCPVGSSCFVFAGIPTCLQGCHGDEDCTSGPDAERRCSVLKDVMGQQTGACISASGGQQIGEQCLNDFECESGTCETLGDGLCSQSGKPCFTLTEATDCGADEFCLVTGDNQVGACTQTCSLLVPCQGTSLCQGIPGVPEGWCRPPCEGLGANDDCRTEAGFACTYGFALGDSTGQGRYLCMLGSEGKMG